MSNIHLFLNERDVLLLVQVNKKWNKKFCVNECVKTVKLKNNFQSRKQEKER